MAIKITPTLYIGLGGTGARALLRAKQCFMDAYNGRVPSMIEFLAIDTDSNIGGDPIKSQVYGDIKLEKNETLYITAKNAKSKYDHFSDSYEWLPIQNVKNLAGIRGEGAGQVRSNGRFILYDNLGTIRTAIANKYGKITEAISLGGDFIPATKSDGSICPAIVNIVGSIAGGTGCGMLVDMLQLVPKALGDSKDYYIYPWIIMPDIYRYEYPRMSDSVYLNAYGALRELDYLFNLENTNNPLNVGGETIKSRSERLSYAYLINNFNPHAGTIKSNLEIADSVGRSMFLPTNDMGAALNTPMDNIRHWKGSFDLKAEGKACWCVSTGSAEIVYDSQIVGDCIGYSLIRSIAQQLTQISDSNAISQMVQQWMSSPEVLIQEHDANLLIDSILNENYPASISFDKETTVSDIETFINIGTNVNEQLQDKYKEIKSRVESELSKKMYSILNSAHGVGDVDEFLSQLLESIGLCVDDMHKEIGDHTLKINNHIPWENALRGIVKTTIWGGTKIDEDAADVLSQTISMHVSETRNLLRKQYALNVYASLQETIAIQRQKIAAFKSNLEALASLMTNWIKNKKHEASKDSLFRINLYYNALNIGRKANPDDSFKYASQNKISDLLLAINERELFDIIKPWADKQQEVQDAFAKSIDAVLEDMDEEKVKELLLHVKRMSSPMWDVDFGGKLRDPKDLINMFIVGCNDAHNNVILKTKAYSDIFESTDGTTRPYYTSTGGASRIQILTLSCCAPIYAVGNTMSYEEEFNKYNHHTAGYIDQQWNQRMLSEKCQLTPVKITTGPNPLEIWVKSIVLGLIQYDTSTDQYWVESKEHGIPRKGYRVDLAANRESAFDAFKSMNLYKECKESIDHMVSRQGKEAIQSLYDKVDYKNYYADFSIMSERDKAHIEEDIYKVLQNLVDSEINFIKEGGLKV